jgi:kynurenine formamidase
MSGPACSPKKIILRYNFMQKIIDLSIAIENEIVSDPEPIRPKIKYIGHKDTLPLFASYFPGLTLDDLPDGEAASNELLTLSSHSGTHLDAPYHFHSTMDNGKPALTIDEVPLEWCFKPGVKLDFRSKPDGYLITPADIKQELQRINYKLKPYDIVLINTSAAKAYGTDAYVDAGCGVGRDGTLFLLEQGVKITGTDAWSWDAPFNLTKKKYAETKDASLIWEGHKAGREKGYCHLEKLHNLELLPPFGFTVACFPVKIKRASAGWTRAVAII